MSTSNQFRRYNKESNFKRTEFIDLSQGKHIVRFLSEDFVVYDTHFAKMVTFKCLDNECPICASNKQLRLEHGRDANKMPGYIPQRQVGYINVYDMTPVKICPNGECNHEVKKVGVSFPASCPKCNSSLIGVQAQPLNKVKMVSKGVQFFDQFLSYKSTVLDEATQTPLPINSYNFEIISSADKKSTPVLSPVPEQNQTIEVPAESLFDPEKAVISLSADEIQSLLRGVSLKDIFAGRKVAEAVANVPSNNSDLRDALDGLFVS